MQSSVLSHRRYRLVNDIVQLSMTPSQPPPDPAPHGNGRSGAGRSRAPGNFSLSKAEQKARTRSRLRMAALNLFASKGYDATSASEIAALAGVSDRTFFLHFPTKLDAIMGIAEDRLLDPLVNTIASCELFGSDLDVLEHCLIVWLDAAGNRQTLHRRAKLVIRAAALSPTVRGRLLDTNDAMTSAAATGLAQRHKLTTPTLEMHIEAAVVLRVFQGITDEWARRRSGDLPSIVAAHFQAFRHVVRGSP